MKLNNKGFTLMELLVVIAIVGILAIVAVPSLLKSIEAAKIADVESEYDAYKATALEYYTDTGKLGYYNTFGGGQDEFDKYMENNNVDRIKRTPIGGYYILIPNRVIDNNGTNLLKDRKAKIVDENGNLTGDEESLNKFGELFLIIMSDSDSKTKELHITKRGLSKLVKDLGYGNVYYNGAQEIALKIK